MDTSAASRPLAMRVPVVLAVAAFVVVVDQGTKVWAESALAGRGPGGGLGGFLRVLCLYNWGAAFWIGGGSTWIFTVVTAVAVVVLLRFATRPSSSVQGV